MRMRRFVADEAFGGMRVPSERDLAARFGVSKRQINAALHALEAEGLIESVSDRIRVVSRDAPAGTGVLAQTVAVVTSVEAPVAPTNERAARVGQLLALGIVRALQEEGLGSVTIPAWRLQRRKGYEAACRSAGIRPMDAVTIPRHASSADAKDRFAQSVRVIAGFLMELVRGERPVDAIILLGLALVECSPRASHERPAAGADRAPPVVPAGDAPDEAAAEAKSETRPTSSPPQFVRGAINMGGGNFMGAGAGHDVRPARRTRERADARGVGIRRRVQRAAADDRDRRPVGGHGVRAGPQAVLHVRGQVKRDVGDAQMQRTARGTGDGPTHHVTVFVRESGAAGEDAGLRVES